MLRRVADHSKVYRTAIANAGGIAPLVRIVGHAGGVGPLAKGRQEADNSGRFVHIPRQVLRQRLVEQLRPGTIRWGSRLRGFEYGERGVTVTLTDGTSIDAALLVGSDGIFSTVRRQLDLAGDRLNYVGLIVVLGIVEEGAAAVPPLARRRIFETVDGTTRIYAMPFTTTSTMWQLSFPYAEDAARALVKEPAALKAEIVRRCGRWHAPIPEMLRGTTLDGMSGYSVYDRDLLEPHVLRKPPQQAAASQLAAGAPAAPQRRTWDQAAKENNIDFDWQHRIVEQNMEISPSMFAQDREATSEEEEDA